MAQQEDDVSYPQIQPGGSLLLAWQVRNQRVLVVGGGDVAAGRIVNLLNADAFVTCICPASGLCPEVRYRLKNREIAHVDRTFLPIDLDPDCSTSRTTIPSAYSQTPAAAMQDLDIANKPATRPASAPPPSPPVMVLVAIDDPIASRQIYYYCNALRISANIADVPPLCDFYFGSIHRDGPLQIMVSTNGNGPKLASLIRQRIAASLPPNAGDAINKVGQLRKFVRKAESGTDQIAVDRRMKWMSAVSESWSLEDLEEMTDVEMQMMVDAWFVKDLVPRKEDVKGGTNSPL
ncbi:MAG: hypothetical protein Q9162_002307 [Coniocarpon cinnabarinum]